MNRPPDDARERLLRAAADLLRAGGPAAASVRAVCAAAGVTAPTLYHHFGNLPGLHRAVADAAFAASRVRKPAARGGTGPLADVRRGWDAYVRFAAEEPGLFAAITRQLAAGEVPAAARQSLADLTALLGRVNEVRPLRVPPELAARMLWAAAHGAACLAAAGPGVGAGPDLSRHLREAVLAHVGAAGPAE